MSKYNEGVRFLLCVINVYSKYNWILPLMEKRSITIANVFPNIFDDSGRKLNKI